MSGKAGTDLPKLGLGGGGVDTASDEPVVIGTTDTPWGEGDMVLNPDGTIDILKPNGSVWLEIEPDATDTTYFPGIGMCELVEMGPPTYDTAVMHDGEMVMVLDTANDSWLPGVGYFTAVPVGDDGTAIWLNADGNVVGANGAAPPEDTWNLWFIGGSSEGGVHFGIPGIAEIGAVINDDGFGTYLDTAIGEIGFSQQDGFAVELGLDSLHIGGSLDIDRDGSWDLDADIDVGFAAVGVGFGVNADGYAYADAEGRLVIPFGVGGITMEGAVHLEATEGGFKGHVEADAEARALGAYAGAGIESDFELDDGDFEHTTTVSGRVGHDRFGGVEGSATLHQTIDEDGITSDGRLSLGTHDEFGNEWEATAEFDAKPGAGGGKPGGRNLDESATDGHADGARPDRAARPNAASALDDDITTMPSRGAGARLPMPDAAATIEPIEIPAVAAEASPSATSVLDDPITGHSSGDRPRGGRADERPLDEMPTDEPPVDEREREDRERQDREREDRERDDRESEGSSDDGGPLDGPPPMYESVADLPGLDAGSLSFDAGGHDDMSVSEVEIVDAGDHREDSLDF